jgi:hypothetical protein
MTLPARRPFLAAVLTVLAGACAAPSPGPDWGAVRLELERRVERDQAVRGKVAQGGEIGPELFAQWRRIDGENTAWMKDLVARLGWPGRSRVGDEGASNAWLLVQHADGDVDFQERCLELLGQAVMDGEASPTHLAYLQDRVALNRGRPQLYGTQFVQRDGRLEPHPIEDEARVDERRAAVGLEPLADYARRLKGL